jgi:LacI family transcriptional regulator
MAVTITDVANEAGVSKSTVSKVLNNWSTISPETVQRVNNAIKKLNYIPNARAVCFARQTTQNIVYLTNLAKDAAYKNPHMFDIMCGVYQELSGKNYTLTLEDTSKDTYPGESAMREINRRSADGLIIHGSAINEDLSKKLIDEQIPHIIIGHPDFESRLCWIDTDHALAGEYAATHMSDCGYTDVIFVGERKNDYISNQRLKGFKKGMNNNKIPILSKQIIYTSTTRQSAYESTKELLLQHLPEAIVCENNTLALGVVKAISELGLSIPADVAVLSFDSYPYSSIIDPALTVIDINVFDMGIQAGNMMIRKLENPNILIQSYTTLPILIQGESTVPINCKKSV